MTRCCLDSNAELLRLYRTNQRLKKALRMKRGKRIARRFKRCTPCCYSDPRALVALLNSATKRQERTCACLCLTGQNRAMRELLAEELQWVRLGGDITEGVVDRTSGSAIGATRDCRAVAVGSPDQNFNTQPGWVDVFELRDGVWERKGDRVVEEPRIPLPIYGDAGGGFGGDSVALSDDTKVLAVSRGFNSPVIEGEVLIYRFDGHAWVGPQALGEAGIGYGRSVSLSSDGGVLVVGDFSYPPDQEVNDGAVYIYRRDSSGQYVQWEFFTATDDEGAGQLGASVVVSGDGRTVIAGSPQLTPGRAGNAGGVRTYVRKGSGWTELGLVTGPEEVGAAFGVSIGLSADSLRMSVAGLPSTTPAVAGSLSTFRRKSRQDGWVGTGGIAGTRLGGILGQSTTSISDGGRVLATEGLAPYIVDTGAGAANTFVIDKGGGLSPSPPCTSAFYGNTHDTPEQLGNGGQISGNGRLLLLGEPGWKGLTGRVVAFRLKWSGRKCRGSIAL